MRPLLVVDPVEEDGDLQQRKGSIVPEYRHGPCPAWLVPLLLFASTAVEQPAQHILVDDRLLPRHEVALEHLLPTAAAAAVAAWKVVVLLWAALVVAMFVRSSRPVRFGKGGTSSVLGAADSAPELFYLLYLIRKIDA